MNEKTECILKEIRNILLEINDKVLSRANAVKNIEFNTSRTAERKIDIQKEFGIMKANSMSITAVGGGFTYTKNGEKPYKTAIEDYTISDEDIYTIEVIGSGTAGTAIIRIGMYIPRGN